MTTTEKGIHFKKQKHIQYPNNSSALNPVLQGDMLLVPQQPVSCSLTDEEWTPSCSLDETDMDIPLEKNLKPHVIVQAEFNNLVRGLELIKNKAKFLGSRLQEWNMLANDVYIKLL